MISNWWYFYRCKHVLNPRHFFHSHHRVVMGPRHYFHSYPRSVFISQCSFNYRRGVLRPRNSVFSHRKAVLNHSDLVLSWRGFNLRNSVSSHRREVLNHWWSRYCQRFAFAIHRSSIVLRLRWSALSQTRL